MIKPLNIKNIEPKAATTAAGALTGEVKASKAKGSSDVKDVEGEEFANELLASMGEATEEPVVKPIQMSPEQLMEAPSKIIKLPVTNPDAVNPQVFDPAVTQGVDVITQPKTTETPAPAVMSNDQVLKLVQNQPVVEAAVLASVAETNTANAPLKAEVDTEISQAMLKTPQVQTGRSPVIDMANIEVDPQLVNMDDFVSQKNLTAKKPVNFSAYGMSNKAPNQKVAALESDLKSTQTINELAGKSSEAGSSMNSQQFILSAQTDLASNAQVNEAQAPVKVFNMSNVKTDNPNQIMTQITDYIVQAKAAKEPTVNMRVNHEELGMIDIRVQKSGLGQETIAINIGTHSVDGKNFFQANSKDLFSHLTSSGLNVTDLKVETPSQTAKNDFDFGGQSGSKGQSGNDKQFGSEQNQRRHDSDRRQDLWKLLKDNKEAA